MYRLLFLIAILSHACCAFAQVRDSVSHIGYAVDFSPGRIVKADEWVKKWLKDNDMFSVGAEMRYSTLPSDSDAYADAYNYPEFSCGLKFGDYNSVVMHKDASPLWGKAVPVDYNSRMGCIYTLYGSFVRPLYRTPHWTFDYSLSSGVGYCARPYNNIDNVDNEIIGSHLLIFFGAGLHATYRVMPHFGLRAGVEFMHHSNGALARPNKGANVLATSLAIVYYPYDYTIRRINLPDRIRYFKPYWYMDLGLGIGGKTLFEEWNISQYQTNPGEAGYRKANFHIYTTYSFQADFMRRYSRRWASGLGVDLFYGQYANRVKALEERGGIDCKHSPWSVGVSGKHEMFYHNLSLAVSLGVYLYREMGSSAKDVEQVYYERLGIFYHFPALGGLTVGGNVKAHKTKADYTEFVVRFPIGI